MLNYFGLGIRTELLAIPENCPKHSYILYFVFTEIAFLALTIIKLKSLSILKNIENILWYYQLFSQD